MNDNAKKWVKSLRSGEYKQGFGELRHDDTYCALGVACDLAVKDGVIPAPKAECYTHPADNYNRVHVLYCYGKDGNYTQLPVKVCIWLGLESQYGSYPGCSVSSLNDGERKTFAEIADIIESEPDGMFVPEPRWKVVLNSLTALFGKVGTLWKSVRGV